MKKWRWERIDWDRIMEDWIIPLAVIALVVWFVVQIS